MIPLTAILATIAAMPQVQEQAAKAVGWALKEVVDYVHGGAKRNAEAEYTAKVEELRSALERGDVNAIIDRFNANHDVAVRLPSAPRAEG